jgi:hypothetical protein
MTHPPHSTKSLPPRDIDARARLFAEIAAECSAGIFPGDYSEAGISTFAAEVAELFWEMRIAEADRRSQIEQPPAEAACKPHKPPTLAGVAKQASKAGIEVARYEVKPDGTVVIVTGTPAPTEPDNPWPLDEFRTKETKQ